MRGGSHHYFQVIINHGVVIIHPTSIYTAPSLPPILPPSYTFSHFHLLSTVLAAKSKSDARLAGSLKRLPGAFSSPPPHHGGSGGGGGGGPSTSSGPGGGGGMGSPLSPRSRPEKVGGLESRLLSTAPWSTSLRSPSRRAVITSGGLDAYRGASMFTC